MPQRFSVSLLYLEFTLLFVAMPLLVFQFRYELAPYLALVLLGIFTFCFVLLLSDSNFKRFRFWNIAKLKSLLPNVLLHFGVVMLAITLASWHLTPERLFVLPTEQTWLWLTLLVLYPLLSAWPQEVIFRTYLFHRYKPVFRSKQLRVWLSAGCFSLAHLMFANWVAVLGSFVAGLVFAVTYVQSRSTLLVTIEHSLWGIWLFTAGLGVHFDSTMLS